MFRKLKRRSASPPPADDSNNASKKWSPFGSRDYRSPDRYSETSSPIQEPDRNDDINDLSPIQVSEKIQNHSKASPITIKAPAPTSQSQSQVIVPSKQNPPERRRRTKMRFSFILGTDDDEPAKQEQSHPQTPSRTPLSQVANANPHTPDPDTPQESPTPKTPTPATQSPSPSFELRYYVPTGTPTPLPMADVFSNSHAHAHPQVDYRPRRSSGLRNSVYFDAEEEVNVESPTPGPEPLATIEEVEEMAGVENQRLLTIPICSQTEPGVEIESVLVGMSDRIRAPSTPHKDDDGGAGSGYMDTATKRQYEEIMASGDGRQTNGEHNSQTVEDDDDSSDMFLDCESHITDSATSELDNELETKEHHSQQEEEKDDDDDDEPTEGTLVVLSALSASFPVSTPSRSLSPLPCTPTPLTLPSTLLSLKTRSLTLSSKYLESNEISSRLITRLEQMDFMEKEAASRERRVARTLSESADRLRWFLERIREGRLETGEAPLLVEHEMEWVEWICRAVRAGVLHVKTGECRCGVGWGRGE